MADQQQQQRPTNTVATPQQARGGSTVTVASKLPHGLILRNFRMEDYSVPAGGNLRTEKRAVQVGPAVRINGNAVPFGQTPEHTIIGGFALTPGVDAAFFNRWLEANKDSDIVLNGLIFAHEKREDVSAEAREKKALRSGLEQIDVSRGSKDPRMLKGIKTKTDSDADDDRDAA